MSDGAADHISHDVDLVFGDGSNPRSQSTTYYLWNTLASFRTVAHHFSRDADLYNKAWILVVLGAFAGFSSEILSDLAASSSGLLDWGQFEQNATFAAVGSICMLLTYPVLRFVWSSIFRQGSGYSDPAICAASALSIGVSVFLDPLLYLVSWVLIALGLAGVDGPETAYSQASELLLLPSVLVYVAAMAYYFSDALDIGMVRASAYSLLSMAIWVISVLIPVVILFLYMTGDLVDLDNLLELFREVPLRED